MRPQHVDPRHWDGVAARDQAMAEECLAWPGGTAEQREAASAGWAESARKHRRWAIEARREQCGSCVEPVLERRPVNGLCVEIGVAGGKVQAQEPGRQRSRLAVVGRVGAGLWALPDALSVVPCWPRCLTRGERGPRDRFLISMRGLPWDPARKLFTPSETQENRTRRTP